MIAEMAVLSSLVAPPTMLWATSASAAYVAEQCDENREYLQSSVYFGLTGSGVLDELCDMYEQCREQNWDGYGAASVEDETYRQAYRFIESLPWGMPVPTVGAEPDGHVTLEWHRSPRRTLSVSISPDGDLHYAALLGISKAYGSEPFFDEAPAAILNLIQRVCAV